MKAPNRMFLVVLLVCLAPSEPKAAQNNHQWALEVQESASLILSSSPKPDDVNKSFARLLDTTTKIAAGDARFPAAFRDRLQTAAKAFAAGPFGAGSSTALNEAYKIVNGGKDFAFPGDVRDISDAGRVARQYIDRSIKMLESGQSDQAVGSILAFMLLVTTPMIK